MGGAFGQRDPRSGETMAAVAAPPEDPLAIAHAAATMPWVAPSRLEGGGEGLFAARAFATGERMLEEEALALVDAVGPLLGQNYEAILASGCAELVHSCRGRELFRGAPGSACVSGYRQWADVALAEKNVAEREECLAALLAISFNSYSSKPSGRYQVVYPFMSKVNHSCCPNAWVVAPDDGPGQLICLRPMAPGDEVTVSYLNDVQLGFPVELRQGLLAEAWEFDCRCSRCEASNDDTRRFSCPRPGCSGRVVLRRGALQDASSRCNDCGEAPAADVLKAWVALEHEVDTLIAGLPEALYSAWCLCEDFFKAHPSHWLAGRWKRHLAAHTRHEAAEADTPEEAEELSAEAATHTAEATRCLEETLGATFEVPQNWPGVTVTDAAGAAGPSFDQPAAGGGLVVAPASL